MDVIRTDAPRAKRNRLMRQGAVAATLAVAGIAALCHLQPAPPALSRSRAWIDTVRRGDFRVQIRGAGVLEPVDVRWIAATTDGRVERIVLQPGVAVRAGTVLIELTNPELQQAAREAESQWHAAEAEFRSRAIQIDRELLAQRALASTARADHEEARLRANADDELSRAGLISALTLKFSRGKEADLGQRVDAEERRLALAERGRDADLAAARAKVDQLEAAFRLKREQVEALFVRAGRDGVLQQTAVQEGQRVTAGMTLARVAAPRPLKAVVQVPEVQASKIALGQTVHVDTHNGVVDGVVARIDPAAHDGSVTIDVALPAELPEGARPDLSVDALIDAEHARDVLFVGRPVQAEPKGSVIVFRLDRDGTLARRTPVRIGRVSYDAIEILGGLAEGDRVVLSDTTAFDKFDRIRIDE